MRILIFNTAEEIGKAGATLIENVLFTKSKSVLGLATGSSPLPVYRELIVRKSDLSHAVTYNLDEYLGLNSDHPQSYRFFMNTNLFDHTNIDKSNTHVPDGTACDEEAEAAAYDAAVRAAHIDIQLLGIGNNGHIGFNEPAAVFSKMTHVTELTESTISANSRFFKDINDVPRKAISMGIGTIMSAEKIVLIATGEAKSDAVAKAVHGDIDPYLPASILQLHNDCVFLLDRAAASKL